MIKFEDEEKKVQIDRSKVIITVISIVLTLIFTYFLAGLISYNDMLDSFKVTFKTNTLDKIMQFYALAVGAIYIAIYSVLFIVFNKIVSKIYNSRKNEE